MTNNAIITAAARNLPAETLRAIVAAAYAPEYVDAFAAALVYQNPADDTPENRAADARATLAAAQLHTYNEWRRLGLQVKRGEHAAIACDLWMWTDKPNKAQRAAAEERRANGDGDADADHASPHFYKQRASLFGRQQVEKPAPVRVKTAEERAAENKERIAAFNAARRAEREAAAQAAQAAADKLAAITA